MIDCKFTNNSSMIEKLKKLFPESEQFSREGKKLSHTSLLTGGVKTTSDLDRIFNQRSDDAIKIVKKTEVADIEYVSQKFLWKNLLVRYLMAKKIKHNAQKYAPQIVALLFGEKVV